MADSELAQMIRQSAASFIASNHVLERARALYEGKGGAQAWPALSAAGWMDMLAAHPDESGFGLADACALHETLGHALVPEHMISAAHLPALIARASGSALIAGELAAGFPVAVAWQAEAGCLQAALAPVRLDGGRLIGRALNVAGLDAARQMIVSARASGHDKLFLCAVAGVRCTNARLADGSSVSDIDIDLGVSETVCLVEAGAGPLLEDAIDQTRVILSAELLGIARETFNRTLDYMRMRKQFGRPIGSFQALQHRAVDLFVQIELTEAALQLALEQFEKTADPHLRAAAASAVKARASETAIMVAREAIQLHGAIAYTIEHDIGLFVAKAMTLAAMLGNGAQHRRRYAALTAQTRTA